jgi:hypothetical protein
MARLRTALLLGILVFGGTARAQEGHRPQEARVLYDRGVEAHSQGAFAQAAQLFADADALAPNNTALQAAIEAAVQADDPVLALTLVDRTATRPLSPGVTRAVAEAREKFSSRAGRLVVHCSGTVRCEVTVEGRSFQPDQPVWVLAGTRALTLRFGPQSVDKTVNVEPGGLVRIEVDPPAPPATPPPATPPPAPPVEPRSTPPTAPPPPPPEPPSESPLASPWFWVGAGLTTTFALASAWSATDVAGKHDDFVSSRCNEAGSPTCSSASSDGESAQLRTNLLLGATALCGAATLTIAILPASSPAPETGHAFVPVITTRGTF